jgi:hypothetical protein
MVPFALEAAQIIVPAKSNIFGAGHSSVPAPPSTLQPDEPNSSERGGGTLPSGYDFAPSSFWVLHVNSVTGYSGADAVYRYGNTGGIKYNYGAYSPFGGDGTAAPPDVTVSNINSTAGISAVTKTGRMLFLVGVFLGDAEPTVAPAAMNMENAENQVNFRPQIGQTFYIGLGRTTGGTLQNFYAPAGASRLYMGFADGWHFHGGPSWYNDNSGALLVNLAMDQYTTTPEPASTALVALPLLAFAAYWRRKRARESR